MFNLKNYAISEKQSGLQSRMKQQNYAEAPFTIEKEAKKGPNHTFYNYRMNQLKSKVCFYEGQVDPLLNDNASLKENLLQIRRIISSTFLDNKASSDLLRKLLPTGDPSKKLKIDLANLEEISLMVSQQWSWLKSELALLQREIKKSEETIQNMSDKYQKMQRTKQFQMEVLRREKEELEARFQEQIIDWKNKIKEVQEKSQKKMFYISDSVRKKEEVIQNITREMKIHKQENQKAREEYQKHIKRLNQKIEGSVKQFEQGKKLIKSLYQKLMNDKILETTQLYEYMLKAKEQQKMTIALRKEQSEESLNQIISTRQNSIKYLTSIIQKTRSEVSALNDKISVIQGDLDEQYKQKKLIESELHKSKEENVYLSKTLKQKQDVIERQAIKMADTISRYESREEILTKQAEERIKAVQNQKNLVQTQLKDKKNRIETLQSHMSQIQQIWNGKIDEINKRWNQKEYQLNYQLNLKNSIIEQEYLKTRAARQKFQNELRTLKTHHLDELQNVEFSYKKSKEDLIRQHQIHMKKYQELIEEQKIKLIVDFQNKIQNITQSNRKKVSQMNDSHSTELSRLMIKFNAEKEELQSAIKIVRVDEVEMKHRLSKMETKLKNHDKEVEEIRVDCLKKLKRMDDQNQQEKRRLNEIISQQMVDFQKQLEQQVNSMANIQAGLQFEIDKLKEMKGVTAIEDKYKDQITEINSKHNDSIKKLQQQFKEHLKDVNEAHQRQLRYIENNHLTQLIKVRDEGMERMAQLRNGFKKIVIKFAENTEDKQAYISDRISFGIEQADLEKAQLQILVDYVFKTIDRLQNQINFLKDSISSLEQRLIIKTGIIEQFQNKDQFYLEEKLRQRRQEYEVMKKQLNAKMEAISKDCQDQLAAAHQEKLAYTSNMYNEFCTLKRQHENKYQKLQKKYDQLQTLFDDRPSRSEDLDKIKDMMSQKEKMDMQMQKFQKKAETANEIVKYLNLQLQNYKDTYDIFGANLGNDVMETSLKNRNTMNINRQVSNIDRRKNSQIQQISKYKGELASTKKEAFKVYRERDVQSPQIRQLNVFGDIKHTDSFILETKDESAVRQKRFSMSIKKEIKKSEKTEFEPQGGEIMTHASNFIKLIKGPEESAIETAIRDREHDKLKKNPTYRKRRLSKRVTTNPTEHY